MQGQSLSKSPTVTVFNPENLPSTLALLVQTVPLDSGAACSVVSTNIKVCDNSLYMSGQKLQPQSLDYYRH